MHWVSKVVKATVGATERKADIQHERRIARKDELHLLRHVFRPFSRRFQKDAAVMNEDGDISNLF